MPGFLSPAILLRKREYGDSDLITVFFCREGGKLSAIAKAAKKSRKRFGGILELFWLLEIVVGRSRGSGLAVLSEASLARPFPGIGANIVKTAYASYWVELVDGWMEPGQANPALFDLLLHVLSRLDVEEGSGAALSVLFQARLLALAGLAPNLRRCGRCEIDLDRVPENRVDIDIAHGSLICRGCTAAAGPQRMAISKGAAKELLWVAEGDLDRAARVRFCAASVEEGLRFLEAFVPFHLGREPRSLKFLRQIRSSGNLQAPYL